MKSESESETNDVEKIEENKKKKITYKKVVEITEEDEAKAGRKKSTPGVIYLSKIPAKMNVKLIRDYFSNYGQVDRIYLEPREKKRKSQQRSFSEGWVEFKKRRVAKKVAEELNNSQVGGKRRNPWYSELWNIKYLKKFRWTHLNERLAYEQEIRKQRLRQEIALAKKESNFYIQNVEKNEKRKRFEKKISKEEKKAIDSEEIKHYTNRNEKKNDDSDFFKYKHPVFERKTKVIGNDSFLKQIFS